LKKFWNQYTRFASILLTALAITAIALYFNHAYIEKNTSTKKIVVASEHIPPYTKVDEYLTYREVVESEIPGDAIYNLEQLLQEGSYYTGEIGFVRGYPIKRDLLTTAEQSVFGASIGIEDNKIYVAVATNQVKSTGDYIKPGTIVDAYIFLPGTHELPAEVITPKESPRLKNLKIHSRQNSEAQEPDENSGKNSIPAVAIIETTNKEVAADLIYYQELGSVYLLPVGYDPLFYLMK
jgi:Flp pilus assembly protein CpaB